MTLTQLLALALAAIAVENFVLVKFLGLPPFLGRSKKTKKPLRAYLPLITIHCAVLGVAIFDTLKQEHFLPAPVWCVLAVVVFALAGPLFAMLWERLSISKSPKCFEGLPIALVTAGLLAMVFMGFSGLRFW